jgi:hypothetical protein
MAPQFQPSVYDHKDNITQQDGCGLVIKDEVTSDAFDFQQGENLIDLDMHGAAHFVGSMLRMRIAC